MSLVNSGLSVFNHRHALYDFAAAGVMGRDVVDALLPGGIPLEYERELWDYKLALPQREANVKLSADEQAAFDSEICGIVKDVVSFHNSYGGYIVIGVSDNPKAVVGFSGGFDCDEFNKKVKAFTGRNFQCFFERVNVELEGRGVAVGLLYVPSRKDAEVPFQFLKDASQGRSKKAFSRNDIYLRVDDQCIPATTSEHFSLLYTPGKRVIAADRYVTKMPILDSNLGPRDPGFIDFVGRDFYISELWKWLVDRYNPVKLLAGIGGVGKTALAREFCEQVSRAAPFEFQKIVWLSAKKQFYTALQGRYVASSRVDFVGTDGLLRQVCLELGVVDEDIPADASREQLIELVIDTLRLMPALVVVDDIDSLEPDQQQDTFHTLISIFNQTIGRSPVGSRALLTSRLDLGAATGQMIRVKGLEMDEFVDFISMTCEAMELPVDFERGAKRTGRFHRVTEGSPTFASSVLRLVALGESFDAALTKWQGADGEDVRRFAFQRELDQLSDAARSTLYALCILSESNLIELSGILTRSEQQIRDDFADLRRYHLVTHAESHLPGGNRMSVPSSIRMMRGILKEKTSGAKRIEAACARINSQGDSAKKEIGYDVKRVVSLWAAADPEGALSHALVMDRQRPNHPDVKCLLGRAYLQLSEPDAKKAEINFRTAHELNCDRPELMPHWIKAKELLGDWNGLMDITEFSGRRVPEADVLLARANAVERLAQIDLSAGASASAAGRCRSGGDEITVVLNRNQARGALNELKRARASLLSSYFELTKEATTLPDEFIDVWLACHHCFESYVRDQAILYAGLHYLREWWRAVERRKSPNSKTDGVMRMQLERVGVVKAFLERQGADMAAAAATYSQGLDYLTGRLEQ